MFAAVPALADVKAGVEAWTLGNYAAALAEWQGPAAHGDADAQFNLGQAYKLGRGVKQDLAKAEELFGKAAAQGHLQASDMYGLMLFQRGERARALPFVRAAADHGDPRAQYLLGIAHFNGDFVPKDWARAYALVSLAQQAGLPQASGALTQMNQYIPIADRERSVALAQELAAQAQATRARQLAAADLGTIVPTGASPPMITAVPGTRVVAPRIAVAESGPGAAGADYARPPAHVAVPRPRPPAHPALATPRPVALAARPPAPAEEAPRAGPAWRVQLGAFGVPGNAEAQWNRVKSRPEIAGHARLLVPAGRVTKLEAGGYPSQAAAQAACSHLAAHGIPCIVTSS